jgi:2'-5' RNA ligase
MRRLFLAVRVTPNQAISKSYDHIQKEFGFANVRWTDVSNLHFTLNFIGSTPSALIPAIDNAIQLILKEQAAFDFHIVKVGIFGSSYAPKIIWWGMQEEPMLKSLALTIQSELEKIGIQTTNQNFVPHISLGRIEKIYSNKLFQATLAKNKIINPLAVLVHEVTLLESILKPNGSEYQTVKNYNLNV